MGSRKKRAKPAEHLPTPGPYSIVENDYGAEVRGIHGVGVAWCGRNLICGKHGGHMVDKAEALANARAIVAALEKPRARSTAAKDDPAKAPSLR